MEKLMELLKSLYPAVDFEKETALVTNGVLDSVDIVTLISELEDTFSISISMEDIIPGNFDSASKIWEMVQELL